MSRWIIPRWNNGTHASDHWVIATQVCSMVMEAKQAILTLLTHLPLDPKEFSLYLSLGTGYAAWCTECHYLVTFAEWDGSGGLGYNHVKICMGDGDQQNYFLLMSVDFDQVFPRMLWPKSFGLRITVVSYVLPAYRFRPNLRGHIRPTKNAVFMNQDKAVGLARSLDQTGQM